jgi:hypothetical protein
MVDYLEGLMTCDLALGVDTRKELNLAAAVIARLALWGGQAGYLHEDAFQIEFRNFLRTRQDEETGFFLHKLQGKWPHAFS